MADTNKPSIGHLREIHHWISSVYDLDQLLELITVTATNMMNATASSLLLLDEHHRKLFFKVATGEKRDDVKKFEIDVGKGIAGTVAQTGEALLIEDVHKEPRWYREISESIGFDTRSIACVPMKVNGNIVGVVEVIDKRDGSPFCNDDLKILSAFADLAAVAIAKATRFEKVRKENRSLREQIGSNYEIIGESPALTMTIADAFKVANSDATTLIVGESGTGKELLARLIHRAGNRKDSAMIAINCAALPESLLEDELFGHERGAYTGAEGRKVGKFELSDGGTLFLDEIGEMSTSMQAKLLRVLQEGVFYRIGGTAPISVDVRVLAATNKNIEKEVREGNFREDLYYRLNVVQLRMPPLRDRKEDILLLSEHFLHRFGQESGRPRLTLSKTAVDLMTEYHWPGNIRELKNAIERAVVMGSGKEILPEDLPIEKKVHQPSGDTSMRLEEAVHRFKKDFIASVLGECGGNRTHAAKKLGIQRTYLSRLIKQYDLK
ncbi:MAG: sigma-54-dependent Fis family transcriptional regulator [Desulfobacteraceae bacterium]|nr:sigma-54-dependent Fis family transcriptional regulator [Desulfobacteraceae bacterium]